MINMTRRERRILRRGRAVTAREARWATRMARLDYKTSGETGAMRVPTRAGKWPPGSQPRKPGSRRNGVGLVRVLGPDGSDGSREPRPLAPYDTATTDT